jgi:flagellar basal-body rod protein FlgF
VVDAMVDMIALTRGYEMNVRMMQTVDENSAASARLLQSQ